MESVEQRMSGTKGMCRKCVGNQGMVLQKCLEPTFTLQVVVVEGIENQAKVLRRCSEPTLTLHLVVVEGIENQSKVLQRRWKPREGVAKMFGTNTNSSGSCCGRY